jgi:threonine/homoserine/homoserine lactone efflux protein
MNDLGVLLRGIGAGLVISAPVGPVNVLCISRTLAKGRKAGLISGLGAAVADTIYGAIAGFSIHYVIGFLIREEFWIRLFGGTLLIVIGVRYYRRKPLRMKEIAQDQSARSDFATAFLLNLTNPTTVLSFMAVLTALGLRQHKSWWQGLTLVAGIFTGAIVWWIGLSLVGSRVRNRLTDQSLVWMNQVAGFAIGAFGLLTLIIARL